MGSGPNGLAAAVSLARAGYDVHVLEASSSIGGGVRTAGLTLPGVRHDVGSAVHPAARSSPFFRAFGLSERIEWITPEASYAQPLDGGLVEHVAEPGEHAAQAANARAVLVQAVRHVFEHPGAGLVEVVRGTADDAHDEVAG